MNTASFGLHPTTLGDKIREFVHPVTGEVVLAHIGDRSSLEQVAAGEAILDKASASASDPDGFRWLDLRDGSRIGISLSPAGGRVEIYGGVELDAMEFAYKVAVGAGMLVVSSCDPTLVAVLTNPPKAEIYQRWPNAIELASPSELLEWVKTKL